MLCALLLLLGLLYLCLYRLGTRNHDYWQRRGVVTPRLSWFLGTHKGPILSRVPLPVFIRNLYEAFPQERYFGTLSGSTPVLIIRDPDLVKRILTQDFHHFTDRLQATCEKENPLSANLVNLNGPRWRALRGKLSPAFSPAKMRRMAPLLMRCSEELVRLLEGPAARGAEIEMKGVMARFTIDIIASCAFGIHCNSLSGSDPEFYQIGMEVFANSLYNRLRMFREFVCPRSRLLHKLFSQSDLYNFFLRVVRSGLEYREQHSVRRNDFLDILIDLKNKKGLADDKVGEVEDAELHQPASNCSEELEFTDSLLTAQAAGFFLAGFETSASTLSFCLMELAHNPEIQERCYADVTAAVGKHTSLTWEALADITYLDKVVLEALRKHSPVPAMVRHCTKRYEVPGSHLVLQPGAPVVVPSSGLHYDPQHYPDPERFHPERFSAEAAAARHPYVYLPFGEGPRMCLGMRFGLLQTKLGLATLLLKFEFQPSSRSVYPVQYLAGPFLATSADGFHLRVTRRRPSHPAQ